MVVEGLEGWEEVACLVEFFGLFIEAVEDGFVFHVD